MVFSSLHRFVSVSVVSVAALMLAACGQSGTDTNTVTTDTNTNQQVINTTDTPIENVNNTDAADSTTFNSAVETGDVAQCNTIQNAIARESCVTNVVIQAAKTSTDPKICDQIKNEEGKASCLAQLGTDIKQPEVEETEPQE